MRPKIGDTVTCIEETHAYYSTYGGNPPMVFRPGMKGKVVSTPVNVTRIFDKHHTFCLVEYTTPEGQTARVGLTWDNVKGVKEDDA